MKEALQKAIEGGWKPWKTITVPDPFFIEKIDFETFAIYDNGNFELSAPRGRIKISPTLLDPLFWSSLGKALGWAKEGYERKWIHQDGTTISYQNKLPKWKWIRSRFFDCLDEGKDADSFFTALLAKEK